MLADGWQDNVAIEFNSDTPLDGVMRADDVHLWMASISEPKKVPHGLNDVPFV